MILIQETREKLLFSYIRVSTEGQAKKETYNLQKTAIEDFVKHLGDVKVIGEFKDLGVSGSDNSRPEFNEMLNRIDDVDGIMVYDWSRITRDWELTTLLSFTLGKKRKLLYIAKEMRVMDLSENLQKLLLSIDGFGAQQQVDTIRENIKRGIQEFKKKKGYWGKKAKVVDWKKYEDLVKKGVSIRAIAKVLEISRNKLYERIRTRYFELIPTQSKSDVIKQLGIKVTTANLWESNFGKQETGEQDAK